MHATQQDVDIAAKATCAWVEKSERIRSSAWKMKYAVQCMGTLKYSTPLQCSTTRHGTCGRSVEMAIKAACAYRAVAYGGFAAR